MEHQKIVEFDYVGALQDDQACIAFRAKTRGDNPEDIVVVKFVSQYGHSVHKFLAELDCAPRLRYFGPLPDRPDWPVPIPVPTNIEVEAMLRRFPLMKMVLMDYVEIGESPEPSVARQQILDALTKLDNRGFVYGDFRPPNMLFDKAGKLKLIDFDWAREYERDAQGNAVMYEQTFEYESNYARYPSGLSGSITWPSSAKDFARILPQHDSTC